MQRGERDPGDINPDWERPSDWKYKADWDSPNWKKQINRAFEIGRLRRHKWGFITCPACKAIHTTYTLMCRECGERGCFPSSIYSGIPILESLYNGEDDPGK